ncbi:hypothetical protein FKM82_020526 [Ascaphus truei]
MHNITNNKGPEGVLFEIFCSCNVARFFREHAKDFTRMKHKQCPPCMSCQPLRSAQRFILTLSLVLRKHMRHILSPCLGMPNSRPKQPPENASCQPEFRLFLLKKRQMQRFSGSRALY